MTPICLIREDESESERVLRIPKSFNWLRGECLRCGGKLDAIGRSRKNGKQGFDDWNSRCFHKKCRPKDTEIFDEYIYLDVPFENVDIAKKYGAKFDPELKRWYADNKITLEFLENMGFNRFKGNVY